MVGCSPADHWGECHGEGGCELIWVTKALIKRLWVLKSKNCEMFLLLWAHSWESESCCWGELCTSLLVSQVVDVLLCYWTGVFQLTALVWAHQYPSERPVQLVPSCLWPRKLDSVWSCGEWFSTRSMFDRSVLETLQTLCNKYECLH